MDGKSANKRNYFLAQRKLVQSRLKFLDVQATINEFKYDPRDRDFNRRNKVIATCEFCLNNFPIRYSNLASNKKHVCCKTCGSLASKYKGQISKHEFYILKRPKLDYSDVDSKLTISAFGYDPTQVSPFSNKLIIVACHFCRQNLPVRHSVFASQNSKVCCRPCMRKKTVETLKSRYGVSNSLDIPSVKLSHRKSSLEREVERILRDVYKVQRIAPFSLDTGKFQYSFDFYLPEFNLLIECQGDYFHKFKQNGYLGTSRDQSKLDYVKHQSKYELLWIWEHEVSIGRVFYLLDKRLNLESSQLKSTHDGSYLDKKSHSLIDKRVVLKAAQRAGMSEIEFSRLACLTHL